MIIQNIYQAGKFPTVKKKSLYCPTFKSHWLFIFWFINYISFLIFTGLCSFNVN